jgi:hypothetical protein
MKIIMADFFGIQWKELKRYLRKNSKTKLYSKDGWVAVKMFLKRDEPCFELATCHEVGHLLTEAKYEAAELAWSGILPINQLPKPIGIKLFRNEIESWRVCKRICKSRFWNSKYASRKLKGYAEAPGIPKINWAKLKIYPLSVPNLQEKLRVVSSYIDIHKFINQDQNQET